MTTPNPETVNVVIEQDEVLLVEMNEGLPGPPGPRGEKGDKGDKGDQGEPGTSVGGSYIHHQTNPAFIWTVQHNLGFKPTPTVLDLDGNLILGWRIVWEGDNVLLLRFSVLQSGIVNVS